MNPRQKAFADEYIKSGNATDAAKNAGYSEKAAFVTGCRLLKDANVSQYIAERMKSTEKKRVADADEVIQFYTAVMRGEVKDQFGLDSSLQDRLKAADALMKRHNAAGTAAPGQTAEDDPLTKALREVADSLAGK